MDNNPKFVIKQYVVGKERVFMVLTPTEKLTDVEYDELKPLVEHAGGHWRESLGGFCFSTDALLPFDMQKKNKLQFFPTPLTTANKMVDLLDIKSYKGPVLKILEPSAGMGDLLEALHTYIKANKMHYSTTILIKAVEPAQDFKRTLSSYEKRFNNVFEYINDTFENYYERCKSIGASFTHILMNPPFNQSRDIKHTMMAYDLLEKGGVLVGIVSENAFHYEKEINAEFKAWIKAADVYVEPLPYGTFECVGSLVDTVMLKVVKQ